MPRALGCAALLFTCACAVATPAATSPSSGGGDEPAPAPDASSPAAVTRPGGPLSSEHATCDGAHDHCLRPETWFALLTEGADRLHPVFPSGDQFYDWDSLTVVTALHVYRTRPATAADLGPGATVLFYKHHQDPTSPPSSESEAMVDWRIDTVATLDEAAGTFEFGSGSKDIPVDIARVIVETR